MWSTICRPSWTSYAQRCGYDLVVIDRLLDASKRAMARSPAWQKCLIFDAPEVRKYERVVWLDSDIIISPTATAVDAEVPSTLIGAVDESRFPSREMAVAINADLVRRTTDPFLLGLFKRATNVPLWHQDGGAPLDLSIDAIVQTGVLVMSPDHADVFRHVYEKYEDRGRAEFNYEMRPLSYEIITRKLVHWLPGKWNAVVATMIADFNLRAAGKATQQDRLDFCRRIFRDNYFIHFAGIQNMMPGLARVMLEVAQPLQVRPGARVSPLPLDEPSEDVSL